MILIDMRLGALIARHGHDVSTLFNAMKNPIDPSSYNQNISLLKIFFNKKKKKKKLLFLYIYKKVLLTVLYRNG
jgi:hypothetical protein